ncbi:unnamed protein product [Ceratitis capitata]|uniref:(Mediterranean fruit fly) hypothetical protein n=1 Tax=Ceratitis capitata TaxID=7213 RepID=A0A811VMM6_CERCA|nr:unnamed protein product [Ceratitis capitata]
MIGHTSEERYEDTTTSSLYAQQRQQQQQHYQQIHGTLNASPRHTSISPVQRHSPSNAYISTATHRIGSPVTTLNKNGLNRSDYETSRTVEKSSTYNRPLIM